MNRDKHLSRLNPVITVDQVQMTQSPTLKSETAALSLAVACGLKKRRSLDVSKFFHEFNAWAMEANIPRCLIFFILHSLFLITPLFAQEPTTDDSLNYFYSTSTIENDTLQPLTLDEAIRQALENNYNIIIARNDEEVAGNNVFIGNAGFLPRLNLVGNYQRSVNDVYIEFIQGGPEPMAPIDRENAQSMQLNGAVELSYTLFDGLSRIYNYSRLQELQRVADAQTQQTVESTLFQVVSTFLEVARLQREVDINEEAVAISVEREQRAQSQYLYGGSTKLDVLNAQVDLNTDSVTLSQTKLDYANAQRNLNVLLGRPPSDSFQPIDNFDVNRQLSLDQLLEQTQQNNAALQLADYSVSTARLDEKIANARYFPSFNLSGSYNYLRQENDASFLRLQEQLGFTGGVSLNYTLFDASVRSTQAQNATIALESQEQSLSQTRLEVRRDLLNAYATYENSLYLLKQEQQSLETAQLNFERSETAFRLGQINATALRTAQLNLVRARQRLNNLYYQTKQAEARLYQITGSLRSETVGE